MPISQTEYVNITSGIGAGESVPERQLIARLFSHNSRIPPQTVIEFDGGPQVALEEIGTYFGTTSQDYLRAAFYFSFVSKNITQPQAISFSRYVDTAVAGIIYGAQATYALATFTAVSTGSINLTIGAIQATLTGINLSGDASLAAVAATLQTAIQAHTAGGADWTATTVNYVAAPTQGGLPQFVLTGGVVGVEAIAIAPALSGTDIGPLLGLESPSAIVCQGSAVETVTQTLTTSATNNNNFGSFCFVPVLSESNIVLAAQWNNEQNVYYQYQAPTSAANASTYATALAEIGGVGLTLAPLSNEYPEMVPMAILAATNYNATGSVQNYEFQYNFDLTPSVTDNTDKAIYDALGVNYWGQTQSAGKLINFYQQGVLQGTATDPVDMNTYANEQWLKDAIASQLLSLLLALANVSADSQGVAQVTVTLQTIIQKALSNGTIVTGKPLDAIQQLYITNATGSNTAWLQVQNKGYWLNVTIVPVVVDSVTKYTIAYTLIYSKDDIIRQITGTDVLI